MPLHLDPRELQRHPEPVDEVRQALGEEPPSGEESGPLRLTAREQGGVNPLHIPAWVLQLLGLLILPLLLDALGQLFGGKAPAVSSSTTSSPGRGGAAQSSSPAKTKGTSGQTPAAPPSSKGGTGGGLRTPPAGYARPGFLGITMTDPPADWTVRGCEVVHALPGTPAAAAGLVGSKDRLDPVGDVITSVSMNGVATPVPDCAVLQGALARSAPGMVVTIQYFHRIAELIVGRWVARTTSAVLIASPCPPPVVGTITSAVTGNRILLHVALVGPTGVQRMDVMLDTGGVRTYLPFTDLAAVGYRPYATGVSGGLVVGATETVYYYRLPAGAVQILDGGRYVPVTDRPMTVMGVPGTMDGLGPDILKAGASLNIAGSSWSLRLPCP